LRQSKESIESSQDYQEKA